MFEILSFEGSRVVRLIGNKHFIPVFVWNAIKSKTSFIPLVPFACFAKVQILKMVVAKYYFRFKHYLIALAWKWLFMSVTPDRDNVWYSFWKRLARVFIYVKVLAFKACWLQNKCHFINI